MMKGLMRSRISWIVCLLLSLTVIAKATGQIQVIFGGNVDSTPNPTPGCNAPNSAVTEVSASAVSVSSFVTATSTFLGINSSGTAGTAKKSTNNGVTWTSLLGSITTASGVATLASGRVVVYDHATCVDNALPCQVEYSDNYSVWSTANVDGTGINGPHFASAYTGQGPLVCSGTTCFATYLNGTITAGMKIDISTDSAATWTRFWDDNSPHAMSDDTLVYYDGLNLIATTDGNWDNNVGCPPAMTCKADSARVVVSNNNGASFTPVFLETELGGIPTTPTGTVFNSTFYATVSSTNGFHFYHAPTSAPGVWLQTTPVFSPAIIGALAPPWTIASFNTNSNLMYFIGGDLADNLYVYTSTDGTHFTQLFTQQYLSVRTPGNVVINNTSPPTCPVFFGVLQQGDATYHYYKIT